MRIEVEEVRRKLDEIIVGIFRDIGKDRVLEKILNV